MGQKCTVTNTVHKYQYHQIYEFDLFLKKKKGYKQISVN